MILNFGKHKGKPLAEVERRYLEWLQGAFDAKSKSSPITEELIDAVDEELAVRDRSYDTF